MLVLTYSLFDRSIFALASASAVYGALVKRLYT
jgi:hypothetical protein